MTDHFLSLSMSLIMKMKDLMKGNGFNDAQQSRKNLELISVYPYFRFVDYKIYRFKASSEC